MDLDTRAWHYKQWGDELVEVPVEESPSLDLEPVHPPRRRRLNADDRLHERMRAQDEDPSPADFEGYNESSEEDNQQSRDPIWEPGQPSTVGSAQQLSEPGIYASPFFGRQAALLTGAYWYTNTESMA